MKYHVISAEHVSAYVVRLKFRDGTVGEIDLSAELTGPIFEPLRDLEVFKRFRIHPEFHTLMWPNGADFAPEYLYENLKVTAQQRCHRRAARREFRFGQSGIHAPLAAERQNRYPDEANKQPPFRRWRP